jgi:hypothetical protein
MLGWLASAASGGAGWPDVYVQLGYSNTVLSVAFSPDGRTLAALDLASYLGDQVPKAAGEIFKREQFPNLHHAGQSFPIVSSH